MSFDVTGTRLVTCEVRAFSGGRVGPGVCLVLGDGRLGCLQWPGSHAPAAGAAPRRCAQADKTIKMWREDETATPESHPIDFKPPSQIKRF